MPISVIKCAFQHAELELEHLLDRKQRTAVQPEGGSMNGAQLCCSSAFFPPKAIICSLITRKLSWLLSLWPFCIFSTPFSIEGHISVTSQITGCGKFSLVSRYCRNYGFSSLKCPRCSVAMAHFRAEWLYSLVSIVKHGVGKTLFMFLFFCFCLCCI